MASYITSMVTSIQVSNKLLSTLKQRKMYDKESYEDIIWDLMEDTMELSDNTKKHIAQSEREIKQGKTVSLSQVKKNLGL